MKKLLATIASSLVLSAIPAAAAAATPSNDSTYDNHDVGSHSWNNPHYAPDEAEDDSDEIDCESLDTDTGTDTDQDQDADTQDIDIDAEDTNVVSEDTVDTNMVDAGNPLTLGQLQTVTQMRDIEILMIRITYIRYRSVMATNTITGAIPAIARY